MASLISHGALEIVADRLLDDQARERQVRRSIAERGGTNRDRASCLTVGTNTDGGTAR